MAELSFESLLKTIKLEDHDPDHVITWPNSLPPGDGNEHLPFCDKKGTKKGCDKAGYYHEDWTDVFAGYQGLTVTKVGSLCVVTGVGLLNYDHVYGGAPFITLPSACRPEATLTFMLPIFTNELQKTDDEGRLQPFGSSMERIIVMVDDKGVMRIDKGRMAADLIGRKPSGDSGLLCTEDTYNKTFPNSQLCGRARSGAEYTRCHRHTKKCQHVEGPSMAKSDTVAVVGSKNTPFTICN